MSLPFNCVGDIFDLIFMLFAVRRDGENDEEPIAVYCVSLGSLAMGFAPLTVSSKAPAAEETKNSAIDTIKSFIAGCLGGFSAILTRLQAAALGAHTGAIDTVRKALSRDGVTGVYRGMVHPLLGVTPIFAVSFWACDASKSLILTLTPKCPSEKLSKAELPRNWRNYRSTGALQLLCGVCSYQEGPDAAGSSAGDLNLGAIMFAVGTAGVAMRSIVIPPDVLKSRMQSAPSGAYSGIWTIQLL
ncbi:hypothetical protein P692DRAFT_20880313 [Suillus brevipes Sb2]|nr:hypothetical protein P692DRAFT_20880313 [Suillus brevipes Sb2]